MNWEEFCKSKKIGQRFLNPSCSKLSKEIRDKGWNWLNEPKSLVLTGFPGTGKTQFSISLAKCIFMKYGVYSIEWVNSKLLDQEILDSFANPGGVSWAIRRYTECQFLFIDDLGVERDTDRIERDYYEIIDSRWGNLLPTVLTTNLDPNELLKRYGKRIYSRLKDADWIYFDGPDLRGNTNGV